MLVGAYLASIHFYGTTTTVYTQRLEIHIQFKIGRLETPNIITLTIFKNYRIKNTTENNQEQYSAQNV